MKKPVEKTSAAVRAGMAAVRTKANAASLKSRRSRKYEADPATLHPDDRPTGQKLAVDPIAVADLCKALGFSR